MTGIGGRRLSFLAGRRYFHLNGKRTNTHEPMKDLSEIQEHACAVMDWAERQGADVSDLRAELDEYTGHALLNVLGNLIEAVGLETVIHVLGEAAELAGAGIAVRKLLTTTAGQVAVLDEQRRKQGIPADFEWTDEQRALFAEIERRSGETLDWDDKKLAWRLHTQREMSSIALAECARKWKHEERRVAGLESRAAGYGEAADRIQR